MAVVSLNHVAEILNALNTAESRALAVAAQALATEINDGITKYSAMQHPTAGKIYAYEVDGYGTASRAIGMSCSDSMTNTNNACACATVMEAATLWMMPIFQAY
jgi:L-aminopeptidase/D-esterase-like protein